ncbi:MAG: YbaB/EbfC family nucleoid-associated protein [Bacteroides sp.]|nr:YbaB/EbfC family nucleoid-associated protein [Eubacterium sp.]MCM1419097.1 YbaB/EbfC family nucleoid-associated protein [Roseburia sp.]MCM1462959.1 YbaB/EbfC family nucleoid-associated protein [Bacteroides sp.]
MKARLPQGYSNKGVGNMNQMVKQAQKMQEDIQEVQDRLEQTEFKETAGGGMVELTMTGGRVLKEIKLNPEIVDPEDIEGLEDVIIAGVNAILAKVDEESAKEMEKVTGGVSFPGLF